MASLLQKLKKEHLVAAALFFVAVFFRFYNISQPFWVDEVNTLFYIQHGWKELTEFVANDFSPPLYYYLLKGWMALFGNTTSEWAARFPSVIFGILSLPFLYLFGKKVFSRRIGILASLFYGLSFISLYYSWEARMYSLAIFLAILSALFLFRALEKNRLFDWVFYVLFTAAGVYTHYSFWFFVVGEVVGAMVFLALRRGEPPVETPRRHVGASLRGVCWSAAAILLLYLPWFSIFLERLYLTQIAGDGFWTDSSGVNSKFFISDILISSVLSPMEARFFLILCAKIFIILSLFGAFSPPRYFHRQSAVEMPSLQENSEREPVAQGVLTLLFPDRNQLSRILFVFSLFFIPFFILSVLDVYILRYAIIGVPFFLLFFASGFEIFIKEKRIFFLASAIAISIMLISSLGSIEEIRNEKPLRHWDAIAEFLEDHEGSDGSEAIVVRSTLPSRALKWYYTGKLDIIEIFPDFLFREGEDREFTKTGYIGFPVVRNDSDIYKIAEKLLQYKTLWVIKDPAQDSISDPKNIFYDWLIRYYEPSGEKLEFYSSSASDLSLIQYVRR